MSAGIHTRPDEGRVGAGPAGASPNPDLIGQSHQRSQAYGITAQAEPDFSSPSRGVLNDALDENRFLFQHAAPVMETLYDQIVNTHSMVLLTSARGMVLHSLGDTDFLEKASRVALTPGMDWSEQTKGTNAIGTALTEEEALTVHGNQHYLNANKFLTCSAAPIFDPYGQVIGALDVTGDHRSFHQHTLALVRMSAQMIENHMFADIFPKAIRIHFHTRSEFLGTLVEGIAVFSPEGRFISANRSGQFQIGLPFAALKAHTFSSLFGIPISALFELFSGAMPNPKQLVLHNGVSVWCRVKVKTAHPWSATRPDSPQGPQAFTAETGQGAAAHAPAKPPVKRPQLSSLQYLDTGDPQVSSVIHKLRMVSGKDIPVMILGETGTGKDLLAQAIHGDSDRSGQPFVSVNCASIPETLIESELFGYEEGAFTGARKKGAIGKILQAHGGTLFLDEIGDMPKHLQARLLRVLQERRVSPLGAGKEVDVDVAVVCATHKNIKDMIARGDFREDLYYRLNGLVVRLPALRERSDFELVVRKILKALCENGEQIGISPEVMNIFKRYHWPGNFRQLHNLMRTAVVMVGCQGVIELSHLPDDFLEELEHGLPNPIPSRLMGSIGPAQPLPDAPSTAPMPEPTVPEGTRLEDVALSAMAQMLRLHKGNVSAAAKALGVSRNTIYRKKDLLPPGTL
ncbi:MAG TPA: sigma-54-dependent Fis family transcriptional regulator [Hydrogenophaga sp.]|uniref:sigma-54-dependent Fis family transcriptional regulator n=1 Tax=Hydrogenophaga sp. TaxID=1904254 RepID=UPI0008CA3C04|nr:sigma-54-dependent Fis family transcriptional regulator [Hydrogenophaga sp.]MBU4183389.1 sigma-54-dependent Fis family transcriptional regulator [Gammaproteobacteria bacterium]OGA76652.1 MAG: sigma-54-dependent Fis family transcriptional regulator [Burkholderiales bacterium GWE1_65_30]OGA91568.1 MAG: sigma-54-dependent Fis family transcriptional regulator [Burkholderiales bacterium GWF1_66_17]MBU4281937.1 sigma-54-dependent Fis family transcriptional regulator [Gammaproteobacteria bacterium]